MERSELALWEKNARIRITKRVLHHEGASSFRVGDQIRIAKLKGPSANSLAVTSANRGNGTDALPSSRCQSALNQRNRGRPLGSKTNSNAVRLAPRHHPVLEMLDPPPGVLGRFPLVINWKTQHVRQFFSACQIKRATLIGV